MSPHSFGVNYRCYHILSKLLFLVPRLSISSRLQISARPMSHRPNFQGGRRGGPNSGRRGGGRRGGGGGGRGGGRGEQRWWDPAWRAERLRQNEAEVALLDYVNTIYMIFFPLFFGLFVYTSSFSLWLKQSCCFLCHRCLLAKQSAMERIYSIKLMSYVRKFLTN